MANRWERGKLGPYTMPQDFITGGVALAGINNTKPQTSKFMIPPGTLFYSTNTAPLTTNNSLIPSGQAISRSTYSSLFDVIGVNFGVGDGTTTFNLPNLAGIEARVQGTPAASGLYQNQVSSLPEHTHTIAALGPGDSAFVNTPFVFNFPTSPAGFRGYTQALSAANRNANLGKQSVQATGTYFNDFNSAGVRATHVYYLESFYSLRSAELPLGAIVAYIGNNSLSPFGANFLLCNGQTISASTYPNAAILNYTVTPDLRGYFISGNGNSRIAYGSTGATGDSIPVHRHLITPPSTSNIYGTPSLASGTYTIGSDPTGGSSGANGPYPIVTATSTSVGVGPALETRPLNMAVNYFMRVA